MTLDHAKLMRDLPIAFLAYEAKPPYTIIDENMAHEKVAMTTRSKTIGRPFLEAFPDTSEAFKKTGKSAPIESIKKIVKTKQPDSLGEFKWDISDKQGESVTKKWRATQYPIFDESGKNVVAVYQLTEDITHEFKTEQTLEQTQKKLFEVLSTGQVGTWSLDLVNGLAKGGPNLSRMFGLDPKVAARGVPLEDFTDRIHPDDRKRVKREIDQAVKSGNLYESEYRVLTDNGGVRWVLARGQRKKEDLDGTNVFSGTLVDITVRKENERILAESESRLRFMADSMPQLVWISGSDGKGEYFNDRWFTFTGAARGSRPKWIDYIHPHDLKTVQVTWKRSIEQQVPYELEYRLYHAASGMHRWVIGRAMPFKSGSGQSVKWYGTCTDIDEQRRTSDIQTFLAKASKELASSLYYQKTLKKVAELCVPSVADWYSVELLNDEGTMFDQISIAHRDPKKLHQAIEYRKVNPVDMNQPTGIPNVVRTGKSEFYPHISDELLEQYIDDEEKLAYMKSLNLHSIIIAPIKINKKCKGAITFVSSDSGRYYTEADLAMANELAARISLSITNATFYADSVKDLKRRRELEQQLKTEKRTLEKRVKERTIQLQLTNQGLRDEIVRRQLAEKELNEFSDELSRSNKELEDFAYVASHDLQEPLRKIQAFGNLLHTEYGDSLGEEGNDYLDRMQAAAGRMSTLIADLLTFSRVTRKAPHLVNIDLHRTLDDVLSDLETSIENCNATVEIKKLPTILADPTHMRQLFQNLVGNALKFNKPGQPPVVTISSRQKKGGHEITIKDNGIGFDTKYTERIFSVFQRLHERSSYDGTGIGLAVCRKITERYGGTITATSKKGEGSSFIVWLPRITSKRRQ